jgi:cardiolipin synthase
MSVRRRTLAPTLRPQRGRRLPPELRAGRVGRLAAALPRGVEDPMFEVLLRRVDVSPILGGNQVRIFVDGAEAFAAMEEAAAQAQREILLESYIFKDDAVGHRFLEMVAAAVRRGVVARVMADAAGSQATAGGFWREMGRRGVEVRLFDLLAPPLWWFQPFRDHRKLLVIDRRVAFTGGMNIGEEYGSPSPQPGQAWRDTHVRVDGPTAWELAVVFDETWSRAGGRPLRIDPLSLADEAGGGARILVLDSRPGRGHVESAAVLAAIVGAARRRVWITNPYFAPGRTGVEVLGAAARSGVDVRLLLPGTTDVPLLRHAAHGYYRDLLASGVRVFEYRGPVLHAKSLLADDTVSVVGSTNLDFRSFAFNAECNLVVLDQATASAMAAIYLQDLAHADEILAADWGRRRPAHRVADRLARWLSPLL